MLHAVYTEEPDLVFFLGDGERDADALAQRYPLLPVNSVRGNCDLCSSVPLKLCIPLGGHRIFAAHGHYFDVKHDPELLALRYAAKLEQADIVLFGHTHRAYQDERGGMLLLNPGPCGSIYASYGRIFLEGDSVCADIVRITPER